jgi:pyruvoyl-dependent arginine decarboxylase (PvlArgDC)
MGSLPTRFWVAQGYGTTPEHKLTAYDRALHMAGIADQNIIGISSVPPSIQIVPIIKDGVTYIPTPENWPKKYGDRPKHFKTASLEGQEYFILEPSFSVDVVLARSEGSQFERITSAIGLIRYKKSDGDVGVFAVEDHGENSVEGSIDNCIEELQDMCADRQKEPASCNTVLPKKEAKKFPLGRYVERMTGKERENYATKIVYSQDKPWIEIYLTTINKIPEDMIGCVLSAVVMDPFTEIHS